MARTGAPRSRHRDPLIGTCYLHTVIDDYSRVAYVEARDDETKETATDVLRNAVAWFAERGVTIQRVLSDNGSCYRSTCGPTPAPTWASPPSGPGPTDRRPTARSNASTAPWPRVGRQEVLQLRVRPTGRPASMDARVQPPPAPLGHR